METTTCGLSVTPFSKTNFRRTFKQEEFYLCDTLETQMKKDFGSFSSNFLVKRLKFSSCLQNPFLVFLFLVFLLHNVNENTHEEFQSYESKNIRENTERNSEKQ